MFSKGDKVLVNTYQGRILKRRVVAVLRNKKVYLCNNEEFEAAKNAGREPSSIGFPIEDVKKEKG